MVSIEDCEALEITNLKESVNLYLKIIKCEDSNEENLKLKEQAILNLGNLLSRENKGEDLSELIHQIRPFLSQISKAKAAMIVRKLIDFLFSMKIPTGKEIKVCQECIKWATDEKRTFLGQILEIRLLTSYYEAKEYQNALELQSRLLHEFKKMDDKHLLMEVQLIESKIYHALSNLSKSRAALTSARSTANSVYCPPKMQAALDLQSGIIHASEEKDFKTAFSYFYEAFEGYDSMGDVQNAMYALKYMLLSKVMTENPDEIKNIISCKLALKYVGRDIEAMQLIASASKNRDLNSFQATLLSFSDVLHSDGVIKAHLNSLYDKMLESNLNRILQAYSRVQIQHIASLIDLPVDQVQSKLSQMILDKVFNGILDQGNGLLTIFPDDNDESTNEAILNILDRMGTVVDTLYNRATKLSV